MKSYKKYICDLFEICKSLNIISSYRIRTTPRKGYYRVESFPINDNDFSFLVVRKYGNEFSISLETQNSGHHHDMVPLKIPLVRFRLAFIISKIIPSKLKRVAFLIRAIGVMR